MQCYTSLLLTAPRAVDGSKGGLTNLYLGLDHPRWIGCMQMSTILTSAVSDWLYANEFVLGSGTAVGKSNLAGGSWGEPP